MSHAYSGIPASAFIKAEADCHTYMEYMNFLGGIWRKQIASNVHVYLNRCDFSVCIELYATDILWYYPDGAFSADAGGHVTMTTATRLCQFGPRHVHFWRSLKSLWSTRGICARHNRYPVEVSPEKFIETAYYEHADAFLDPRVVRDPFSRKKRFIRPLIE